MKRKKIAISQRRDREHSRRETRDGLDIRLGALIWELGFTPMPLSSEISNVKAYLEDLDPDGFILSGGNNIGAIPERDKLEKGILQYSHEHNLPLLGICRGMQMINNYQGGSSQAIDGHVGTMHVVKGSLIENTKWRVNSFHDFAVTLDTLGSDLEVLAICEDEVVEAIKHNTNRWLGIMWHPERYQEFVENDKQLILKHFVEDQ